MSRRFLLNRIGCRRARVIAAVAAVAALLPASTLHAGNFTWDTVPGVAGPGDGSITGGAGTWDATTANWTVDAGANNVVFNNTTSDLALFGDTGGIVTLGSAINLNGITFNVTNYSIAGTGSNTLNFGAVTATITVTNAADSATIGAAMTGSSGLNFAGPGSVVLSSANTYSGATSILGGTVQLSGGDNRLATAGSIVLGTGAASGKLILGDAAAVSNQTLASLTTSGTGTTNTVVGGNASNSTLTINNSTAVTFGGILGGTGTNEANLALTKTGAGTLTLTGTNKYKGITTIAGGTLVITSDVNLGAAPTSLVANAVTLDNGATLSGGGAGGTTAPPEISKFRGLTVGSGGGTLLNSTANEFRYAGKITGGGALTLTVTGSANLVIDNGTNTTGVTTDVNDYSGGTIISGNGGGMVIPIQSSAGTANNPTSGPFGIGTITFAGGGFRATGNAGTITLHNRLNFTASTTFGSGSALAFLGDVTLSGGTRTLSAGSAGTITFSGVIGDGGGNNGLTKTGTGAGGLTLTGNNTYTGPTTISAGTLNIPIFANGGLASPLGQSSNAASNLVLNGGTLNYTGATTTTDRNITASGTSGLGVASTNATLTLAGTISGSGTLTLTGAGISNPSSVILSQNPSFTGGFALANGLNLPITNINQLGTGAKTLSNTNGTTNGTYVLDGTGGNLDFPSTWAITSSSGTTADTFKNIAGNNIVRGAVTIATGGGGLELNSTAGKLTMTGNITANATSRFLDVRGAGDVELSGVISNGSTLSMPVTKSTGAGTLTLSGANTFTGGTTISIGTLKLSNAGALGNNAGVQSFGVNDQATIASGATIDLNGQSGVRKVIVISGTGVGGAGALVNNSPSPASLDSSGALAGLFLSGTQTGFTDVPTLTISGGGGSGATATTTLGVTVASFAVAGGTTVYSAAPSVTIAGGTGATASAVLTSGKVTGITINNAGTGFTGGTTPTITFSGGTVTTAGTNPTGTGNTTNYLLVGGTMTAFGTGYTSVPTIGSSQGSAVFTSSPAAVQLAANSSIGGSGDMAIPIVTGGFNLTKVGAGTLSLTAASTYTGSTTVSTGTLNVTGSLTTSALSLAANSKFNYTPTPAATMTLANGLTLGGNNLLGINFGSQLSSTTPATTTGTITFNPSGSFTDGTAYTLLSAPSGLSGATYSVLNPANYTFTLTATDTSVVVTPTSALTLSSAFWKGGTSGVWAFSNGTSSNWTTDAAGTVNTPQVPGSTTNVTFSATGAGNQTGMTLGSSMSVGSLTFGSSNQVILTNDNNTLTINGGITMSPGSLGVALQSNIVLGAAQSWTNNSSSALVVGFATSTVTNPSFLLTISGAGATEGVNYVTGGGLTLASGTGSFELAGTTTLTAAQTWTNNGATSFNVASINNGGFTLTLAGTGTTTSLESPISGSGGIVKSGTGTATFAASNTYTGTTIIDQGTLGVSSPQNLPGILQFATAPTTTTTIGTLDLTAANATFGGLLAQGNNSTGSTITIPAGRTLTFNGNVVIGGVPTAATTTKLSLTGGGALVVNSSATLFQVGGSTTGTSGAAGDNATLDLHGLGSVNISVGTGGTFRINNPQGGNTNGVMATLIMPTPTVATGTPVSSITAGTFAIGDNGAYNASANQINSMTLGTGLTTLNVDTINIGTGGRDFGQIINAAGNGSLVLRNSAGTGRVAINIGTGTSATANGAVATVTGNVVDLTGHSSDLLIGTLTLGNQTRNSTAANDFKFNTGTLDATTVIIAADTAGNSNSTNSPVLTSTLAIGGGTVTIGAGAVTMGTATNTSTGARSVVGNLNVSGGTVTIGTTGVYSVRLGNATGAGIGTVTDTFSVSGGSVTLAGPIVSATQGTRTTANLSITGGTLNMSGNNIGANTAATNLTAVTFTGGTLRNAGTIFLPINQAGSNSILDVLSNNTSVGGAYTQSAGTASVAAGFALNVTTGNAALAGTYSVATTASTAGRLNVTAGDLDLSATTDTLDVRPSVNSAAALIIATYTGTRTNFFDNASLNGVAEGAPSITNPTGSQTLYTYPDYTVLYDDGAKNVQLTVTNAPEPATIGLAALAGCGLLLRRRRRTK